MAVVEPLFADGESHVDEEGLVAFHDLPVLLGAVEFDFEKGELVGVAPVEFDGNPADYDLADICGKIILESAKKLKESDVRGKEEELEGGAAIQSSSKFNIEQIELGKMN